MFENFKKLLCYIIILFTLSALMVIYVVQMTGVVGHSMEPELQNGQSVLVNKLIYKETEPKRFDVVVFRYLYKDDEYYLKRVIGLPGETVQIMNGTIYIDGLKLEDPFASTPILQAKRAEQPITLGEDEYFVMGDNRNFSSDSRESDVGNVKKEQLMGKAFLKLWPIERIYNEG